MSGIITGLGFIFIFFLTLYLSRNGLSLIDSLTIVFFAIIFFIYFFTNFLQAASL